MLKLKIPPPVYALLCVAIMWLLSRYVPVAIIFDKSFSWFGIALIMIALCMDFWSLALFFKKRTTPNPLKPEFTTGLVTTGLYRFSRNPMYLGLLLMLIGFAIFLRAATPFLVLPVFYLLINEMQIKPEENILGEKFGQEFLEYKNKVRRWL